MSSEPDRAADRDGEKEAGAARVTAVAQTWPIEARTLLALAVAPMAIGLMIVCRDAGSSSRGSFASSPNLVLDANSAPPRVLEAVPTLGPALVGRFVAARAERPFSSLADARSRVRGLGPASLAQIAPYLRFETGRVARTDEVESQPAAGSKRESIETADVSGERVDRLIGRR
ncbi:MAG: ComEA family DNA-binding protein [Isosphaeraceae bacterium]